MLLILVQFYQFSLQQIFINPFVKRWLTSSQGVPLGGIG